MSDSTLTRYLKLKVAADLSADAKYNLNRIDSLGFLATVNDDDSLNLVARGDIEIEPNSADVGGSGQNGSVNIGTTSHTIDSVTAYVSSFLIKAGFKLANQASSSTNSLQLDFNSADDTTTDRTLTVDVDGSNRELSIEDSGRLVVQKDDTTLSFDGPLSVAQGGTGYTGSANSATALNNLVPTYSPSADGDKVLAVKAGVTPELYWKEGGTGSLSNVGLVMPDIFSVAGSPVEGVGGTLTVTKVAQAKWTVYAGPIAGANADPTFRLLTSDDIPTIGQFQVSGLLAALANKEPLLPAGGDAATFLNGNRQFASVTKSNVGLGNVDNTSDVNKPISSAVQTALDGKEPMIAAGTSSQYWRGDKVWSSPVTSDINDALQTQAPDCTAVKNYVSAQVGAGMFTFDWLAGNSTNVSHNFGTQDVMVSIYDKTTFEEIYVDSVVRTDTSKVTLTSSTAPSGSGWRVLVRK